MNTSNKRQLCVKTQRLNSKYLL